ncbi:MAG: patatin-like phospholipase family protein [Gammaproteobacteria bacterium]|nr:patatin-like phospholipase family protein [Gammaproteobacteria bacterium]
MPQKNLVFKAGREAFDSIRREGFAADRIGTLAGASGGAKWLVLSQLDRAVVETVLPKLTAPVHLIGSSIGAWRFACYAQADPLRCIERFEDAYIEQRYSDEPDIHEISAKTREILDIILGDGGVAEILDNPLFRFHVMTVRSRHLLASENRALLGAGLIAAASMNAIRRQTLGWFFERALFFDERAIPPFIDANGFPLQTIPISAGNLEDVIVATGAIPLVLSGVPDIAGANPGMYRDGGVIDYHLDLPHSAEDRFTLYPHFYERIVPGWFDKKLTWRRPDPAHVTRTILVSPSAEFVARLPGSKIPDRTDFHRYTPNDRIRTWRRTVAECQALADEFRDVMERGTLAERLQPL